MLVTSGIFGVDDGAIGNVCCVWWLWGGIVVDDGCYWIFVMGWLCEVCRLSPWLLPGGFGFLVLCITNLAAS